MAPKLEKRYSAAGWLHGLLLTVSVRNCMLWDTDTTGAQIEPLAFELKPLQLSLQRCQWKQVCRFSWLSGQNVRWPRRMLSPSRLVTVSMLTGQTDRRPDARQLHFAFCYGRSQRYNLCVWLVREISRSVDDGSLSTQQGCRCAPINVMLLVIITLP